MVSSLSTSFEEMAGVLFKADKVCIGYSTPLWIAKKETDSQQSMHVLEGVKDGRAMRRAALSYPGMTVFCIFCAHFSCAKEEKRRDTVEAQSEMSSVFHPTKIFLMTSGKKGVTPLELSSAYS